ncbi:hypothetical protein [Bradyrhizobium cenepequi]
MAAVTVLNPSNSDALLVKLAREIAMDIQPLETILKQYSLDANRWEKLKENGKFQALLFSETEAWNSAQNTHDRVKLKSAAMLEEFLPELNNRLHDGDEALPAKIEGLKVLTKIAGIGERAEGAAGGERFTVTINLGEDSKLITIDKMVASKTIEHDPAE